MGKVLKGVPESFMSQPPGLVSLETVDFSGRGPRRELFYQENAPLVVEPEPLQEQDSRPYD